MAVLATNERGRSTYVRCDFRPDRPKMAELHRPWRGQSYSRRLPSSTASRVLPLPAPTLFREVMQSGLL